MGNPNRHKDEERYLAAGWPDYTTDPKRAMRDEPPPMPESMEEKQERSKWLALALGNSPGRQDPPPRKRPKVSHVCGYCGAVLVLPGKRTRVEAVRYCHDGHRKLARNQRMRGSPDE